MPCPSYLYLITLIIMWWKVRIMKLLGIYPTPASCHSPVFGPNLRFLHTFKSHTSCIGIASISVIKVTALKYETSKYGRIEGYGTTEGGGWFHFPPPTDRARADTRGSRTIYCSRQCVLFSVPRINSLAVSPATAVQVSFQFSL